MKTSTFQAQARLPVLSKARHAPSFASRSLFLVAVVSLICSGGCQAFHAVVDHVHYSDSHDDFMIGLRNRYNSWQAWQCVKDDFADHAHLKAFAEGFRAGYSDVASGGKGCPPPLPPRKYWSWKYQDAEGQAAVAAWFDGFPHGAAEAEQEGLGNYREIQVSHFTRAQYLPPYKDVPSEPSIPFEMPLGPEFETVPPGIPLQQPPPEFAPEVPTELSLETRPSQGKDTVGKSGTSHLKLTSVGGNTQPTEAGAVRQASFEVPTNAKPQTAAPAGTARDEFVPDIAAGYGPVAPTAAPPEAVRDKTEAQPATKNSGWDALFDGAIPASLRRKK